MSINILLKSNNNSFYNALLLDSNNVCNNDNSILWNDVSINNINVVLSQNEDNNKNIILSLEEERYTICVDNNKLYNGTFKYNDYYDIMKCYFMNSSILLEDKEFISDLAVKFFGIMWEQNYSEENKYVGVVEKIKSLYSYIKEKCNYNLVKKQICDTISNKYIDFLISNTINVELSNMQDRSLLIKNILELCDNISQQFNIKIYTNDRILSTIDTHLKYIDSNSSEILNSDELEHVINNLKNMPSIEKLDNNLQIYIGNIIATVTQKYVRCITNNIPENFDQFRSLLNTVKTYGLTCDLETVLASPILMKELSVLNQSDASGLYKLFDQDNNELIKLIFKKCEFIFKHQLDYTFFDKAEYFLNLNKLLNVEYVDNVNNIKLLSLSCYVNNKLKIILDKIDETDNYHDNSKSFMISFELEKLLFNHLLNPSNDKYNSLMEKFKSLNEQYQKLLKDNIVLTNTINNIAEKLDNNVMFDDMRQIIDNHEQNILNKYKKFKNKIYGKFDTVNLLTDTMSDKIEDIVTKNEIVTSKMNEIIDQTNNAQININTMDADFKNLISEINQNSINRDDNLKKRFDKKLDDFYTIVHNLNEKISDDNLTDSDFFVSDKLKQTDKQKVKKDQLIKKKK